MDKIREIMKIKSLRNFIALFVVGLMVIGSISAKGITASATSNQTYHTTVSESGNRKLTITATAADGVLDDDVTLKAEKVTSGNNYQKVKSKVENISKKDIKFLAYDIGFYKDGKKIEPQGDVDVSMTWNSAMAPSGTTNTDDISILHLKENENGTITKTENLTKKAKISTETNKVKNVDFSVNSFSVFAIAWTNAKETAPLDISDKITKTTVSYKSGNNTVKIIGDSEVASDPVNIPSGIRDFEIELNYNNVDALSVKNKHGYQVSYTLPEFFKTASVTNGYVTDSSDTTKNIGTIAIEGEDNHKKAVITFNQDYLQDVDGSTTINNGTIKLTATADESKITSNPITVKIGNAEVKLNFEEKDVASTGTLNIEKSNPIYVPDSSNPANAGYLQYTLTVKTADQAMPDVKVADRITTGSQYVDVIEKADGSSFSASDKVTVDGSTLTWNIGDMAANATETLTYRVKLKNTYVGLGDSINNNKKLITNTATPYSKTYPHTSASSTYTPNVTADVNKTADNMTTDHANGTITIPYTITIKAGENNPWPLRNVKLADNLYNSYTGKTAAQDRQAICEAATGTGLGFQDFHIYLVNGTTQTEQTVDLTSKLKTYYTSDNAYNPRFDLYVGDVPAGQTLKVTYNLVLKESFLTSRNGTWNLNNKVAAYTDDTKDQSVGGNNEFGSANVSKKIGEQEWDRKIQGTATTEDQTDTNLGRNITIPKGSYKYQVVINEEGKWNVSGSTFSDTLGADESSSSTSHMKYVGSLQIDYYAQGISYGSDGIPSDSSALRALQSKTPTMTVYRDIDGLQSFSLTPNKDTTLPNAPGAYVLTYYATPINTNSFTRIESGNSFSLNGSVTGPGDGVSYTVSGGTRIHNSLELEGTSQFTAEKRAWYYDSINNNGKLYWVIEASGSDLSDGLTFKDTTGDFNKNPTLVGAYIGSAGHIDEIYTNIDAFNKKNKLTKLTENEDYTLSSSGNNTLELEMKKTRALGSDEKLYLIVSSEPSFANNDTKRSTHDAVNSLSVKQAGTSTYNHINDANLVIGKGGTNFKEMNRVLERDENGNWTSLTSNQNTNSVVKDQIHTGGIYVDWRIKINDLADLSGKAHVLDTLPDGMEAVYVRYFWVDESLYNNKPTMPAISNLGDGWEDIGLKNTAMDGNTMSKYKENAYAYYNKSKNQIRFDVDNLRKGTGNNQAVSDKYSLEVQIVTKVTDQDVLRGNQKNFTNTMSITDDYNNGLGSDSAETTITGSSLKKTNENQSNGKVPFTLTINSDGSDLANGADTITVTDELSKSLSFDLDSIKAKDKNNNDIAITVADGGVTADGNHLLNFTVPNRKKIVITYDTSVQAAANATYSFTNKAYWKDYTGGSVTDSNSNWTNAIAASAELSTRASIQVTKRDQTNLATKLAGAAFSLQKVTWDDTSHSWVEDSSEEAETATTDSDGTATFSNLDYNTVYKLTETRAPEGYFKNATAQYIVIANQNETNYDSVASDVAHGAIVQNTGNTYKADVSDTPIKILLKKTDMNGKALTGATFTLSKKNSRNEYEKVKDVSVNDSDGVEINDLSEGTYQLTETKAPDGYNINSAPVEFKVSDSGITLTSNDMAELKSPTDGESTYVLSIKNSAGAVLPNAGGRGTTMIELAGALLVSLVIIFYKKRRDALKL